jgi:type IV pilus assembly protein PilA
VNRAAFGSRRDFSGVLTRSLAIALFVVAVAGFPFSAAGSGRQENDNEKAAIRAMIAIHAAQMRYFSQYDRYAAELRQLGPATGDAPVGPEAAGLIPVDLASGIKNGYQFDLDGTANSYTLRASPVSFGKTGRRTFYSNQLLVIREHWGPEPATENSKEIQGN